MYICGDKASVADCKVIAAFYASVYNENMPMGPGHREQAKQAVAKFPRAQKYFESTVPTLLGQYLANRPVMQY